MNYIVLDLEATFDKRKKDFREIIEIGAYKINEDLEVVGYFQTYVKPVYHNHVAKHISKLTGISNQIKEGDYFYNSIEDLKEWAGPDAVYVGWGKSDKGMIKTNCRKHMINSSWVDDYIDLQEQYAHAFATNCLRLEQAVENLGLTFEGTAHSALTDAKNTTYILSFLYKKKYN